MIGPTPRLCQAAPRRSVPRHAYPTAALLAAVTLMSAGCKSTNTDGPPGPSKPDVTVPTLPPAPAVTNASPFAPNAPRPDGIVAVAGMSSIRGMGGMVQRVLSEVSPNTDDGIDPESMVLEAMADMFGWSDTSWVNLDAPVYVVVSRGAGGAPLLAVPVGNYPAALAAMPKTEGMDTHGHVHAYRHNSQTVFVDTVGRHLVLTSTDGDFGAMKPHMPRVITWKPTGVFTGFVAPQAVASMAGINLEAMFQELPKLLDMEGMTKSIVDPKALVDFAKNLVMDIDMVRISATNPTIGGEPHLGAEMGILPVNGSGLAKFMQMLAQAKVPLPNMMPPQTWLGALIDMDLRNATTWVALEKSFTKATAEGLKKLSGAKAALRFVDYSEQIRKAMTGKGVIALYSDQGFPMAAVSSQALTVGGTTLRKMYNQVLEDSMMVMWPDVVDAFKEVGVTELGKLKKYNTKKVLKLMNKGLSEVALRMKQVKGKDHDAFVLEPVTPKGRAAKDNEIRDMHEVFRAMGGRIEFAVAYGPKSMAAGFGPSGIATAQSVANGRGMGGSPIARNLSLDTAVLGFFNVGELIAAIKGIPTIGAMFPMPDMPKNQAMLMGMRSDGKEATFSYVLPLDYAKFFAMIF